MEKNISKIKRNSGQKYISRTSKKLVDAKKVGTPCGDSCRIKYSTKISENGWQDIHRSFWKLGDNNLQRSFILQCMENIIPKYRMSTPGSKRTHNNAYYFEINNIRIRVCKTFFMRTLDISSKMIFTTTKKKNL